MQQKRRHKTANIIPFAIYEARFLPQKDNLYQLRYFAGGIIIFIKEGMI